VQKVFQKWDLDAVVIGKVTDDKMLRVKLNEQVLAEIRLNIWFWEEKHQFTLVKLKSLLH
jgi:phosphoribosylformylglycinamidine (FGAM) synthase-like enzyme